MIILLKTGPKKLHIQANEHDSDNLDASVTLKIDPFEWSRNLVLLFGRLKTTIIEGLLLPARALRTLLSTVVVTMSTKMD